MQHILYKKHTNVLTLKSGLIESSQQKMTQWANYNSASRTSNNLVEKNYASKTTNNKKQ